MTREEVNAIISLADVNADGKFDYIKVHEIMLMYICILYRRRIFKGAYLFNIGNDIFNMLCTNYT